MAASKAIGFLNFKFGADLTAFERAMKKAQKKLNKFGKSITKAGKTMTMGLTLPILALGAASIKAFDEQQKAIAQVEAGLKSTGNQVGITSEKLQKMADDLQSKTLFGDEEILKNATAQLLTFTNITGTEFAKTQEIVLDLATRLDGDLKSASIMLGKALNDPVANLSALSRAGIQFSKEQKATINALVETNDLAGAQTIILAELEKQYGGSAEAAAAAGMGPIQQLQNELGDLSEQIGERLLPYVKSFVTWIKKLAEKFDGLSDSQKDNIVKWGLVLAAIGPVLIIFGKMAFGLSALIGGFSKLAVFLVANPWILLVAAIAAAGVAIYTVTNKLWGQYDAQKALLEVQKEARNSIADEITKIELLTRSLKGKTELNEEEIEDLKELQKLYPDYYSELDETTFSSDTLEKSTRRLTDALLDMAMIDALSARITKVNMDIMDLEATMEEGDPGKWATLIVEGNVPLLALDLLTKKITKGQVDFRKIVQGKFDTTAMKNLTAEKTHMLEELDKLMVAYPEYGKEIEKVQHKVKKLDKETEGVTQSTEEYDRSLDPLVANIKDYAENMTVAGAAMEGVETWTKKLTLAQQLGNAGWMMFGDVLTSSLDSALDSQENFFKVFIKNIKRAIRSLLVQLAVMTLIKFLMGGGSAAFSLASIQGNLASIMNIPGLAEGGLVTSPQTVLVGEGIGTTAANPEVIAPLDKLKGMIGGGGDQHITVTGKLIGNDIFLSNAKTGVDRLRIV